MRSTSMRTPDPSNAAFRGFVRWVEIDPPPPEHTNTHPWDVAAIRDTRTLTLHPRVTFLIGENGSGKSTLLEAVAVAAGFNAEGGGKGHRFSTRDSHSSLYQHMHVIRGSARESDGFFLRAESFYNVATDLEERGLSYGRGGPPLHQQSHGEAFLTVLRERLHGHGLYLFDEPEAALSPARQMACLRVIHDLVRMSSQFIIATHSPIIMAYPDAVIYELSAKGLRQVEYEDTEHVFLTRQFLNARDRMLADLLSDEE